MKLALFLLFCSAEILSAQDLKKDTMTFVTTTGIIDPRETKSGYQLNEYYLELSHKQIKMYTGKTVEVKGKLLVVEGIDPNAVLKTQGSENERHFILEPEIRIVGE